jgi:Putative DNA-binding domain
VPKTSRSSVEKVARERDCYPHLQTRLASPYQTPPVGFASRRATTATPLVPRIPRRRQRLTYLQILRQINTPNPAGYYVAKQPKGDQVLPFPLHQLTEGNFQQICAEQWPETQTLDFKSILPLNEEDARQEFRKDVCALANAEGGDLVYGISERNSRANAILPVPGNDFDGVKRRLRQILESRIEPRIHGIQFSHCALTDGGFVLVLRVPASYDGPHRFGTTEHRFTIRNDTSTSDMTYDQLRNAFGRGATLLKKAAQFRSARVYKIAAGETPRKLAPGVVLALHIIPISGLAGRANVDIAGLHSDVAVLRLNSEYAWSRVANLDGLVSYPYDDPNGVDCCSQLFRNGSFEVLKNITHDPNPGKAPPWVVGKWVGELVRNGLDTYAKAVPRLGVQGAVVVSLSLTSTENTVLALNDRTVTRLPILENRLDLPEVIVEDIAGELNLDAIARPILDVLYQCYGQPRCNLFDNDGKWCPPQ